MRLYSCGDSLRIAFVVVCIYCLCSERVGLGIIRGNIDSSGCGGTGVRKIGAIIVCGGAGDDVVGEIAVR